MIKNILSLAGLKRLKPATPLTSRVFPLNLPLPPNGKEVWKSYHIFNGGTAQLPNIACHVSVLNNGHSPHKPHTHCEEEILLLLSGEVELDLPETQFHRKPLKAGEFVYYPAYFAHTLTTVSEEPANYLMFKWQTTCNKRPRLTFGHFDLAEAAAGARVSDGFNTRLMFEGETSCLKKLHCHYSTLTPGNGYKPHADPYDVAIIVLGGEVETLGVRVKPHGIIFYTAGEPHGMFNPGQVVAQYLVFEFHARLGFVQRCKNKIEAILNH